MQCDLIAKGLVEKGHEVIYGAVSLPKGFLLESAIGYPVFSLDLSSYGIVKSFLEHHQPDIIYWRFNKHGLDKVIPAAKSLKIPFVYAVSHINDVTRFAYKPIKPKSFLGKLKAPFNVLKQKLNSALQFHFLKDISGLTSLNSEFIGKLDAPFQKVIKNSIPMGSIPFSMPSPFLLWVSSIKASKRPEAYIELAKSCGDLDIMFLMIGPIQQKGYEKILNEAQEMSNFSYLGQKSPEEVNGILKNALLLVHTCEPEGFGNNFIQAWMQSCPTISLSFDPDQIIQNEGLGYVSGSQKQLESDVRKLVGDEKLRKQMGLKAKKYAVDNFSAQRLTIEVEAFLLEILNENSLHR